MLFDLFSFFLPLIFLSSQVAIRQRLGDFNLPIQYSRVGRRVLAKAKTTQPTSTVGQETRIVETYSLSLKDSKIFNSPFVTC